MTTAPLPEIRESDATGTIAGLYAEIRAAIGVPMVNLVFRNMATVLGCLDWAWAHLRPLYASGHVAAAAANITADPALRDVIHLPQSFAATSVLSHRDIAAVGAAYAHANPMNLLGLFVIQRLLDETAPARSRSADPSTVTPRTFPTLPPMIDLKTAPAATRALLDALARQLHQGDNGVIPSLYRHFGAAPDVLKALKDALDRPVADGRLFAAADRLHRAGAAAAEALYLKCPVLDLAPPSRDAAATLRHLIAIFPQNICRMTIVALALSRVAA